MTCGSSEALLEGYLDAALAPRDQAALAAHLAGCGRCAGVLDELRAVEALLAAPRTVRLPENFTFATMAEVRAMPLPHRRRTPVLRVLAVYLVAAWALIAAAFVVARPAMSALGSAGLAGTVGAVQALAALAGLGARLGADVGSLGAAVATAILIDAALALVLAAGIRAARARRAERLRG